MNPDNPVVRLCREGMQAEAEGRDTDARTLFEQAWASATDDYEACVAAHYVARHQPTPLDTLHWTQVCLERADAVGDERVAAFYPSLHANLGRAHRDLGDTAKAAEHFRLAADHLGALPADSYRDWLRSSIADGLRSTGAIVACEAERRIATVLDGLCERRDFRSLYLLLPAYVDNLGTPDDRERLAQAAHRLHAEKRLPAADQETLGQAVVALRR